MPRLRVHFLPELTSADELAGGCVIVVDVLRATTTMIEALAAGAGSVMACASIDRARACAAELLAGGTALGGERGGLPIAGFDLGNSPAEYTPESVGGKTVVLTTTNGTRALLHCRRGIEILIGGFVNLSALRSLVSDRERVDVVCAGTDGEISREDVLLAGALAPKMSHDATWELNDQAVIARDAWTAAMASATSDDQHARLTECLRTSAGGSNLIALGMDRDILLAAEVDRHAIVPRVDSRSGERFDDVVTVRG